MWEIAESNMEQLCKKEDNYVLVMYQASLTLEIRHHANKIISLVFHKQDNQSMQLNNERQLKHSE